MAQGLCASLSHVPFPAVPCIMEVRGAGPGLPRRRTGREEGGHCRGTAVVTAGFDRRIVLGWVTGVNQIFGDPL